MKKLTQYAFLCSGILLLAGCSGNLSHIIPDRTPNYRTSSTTHPLEVPPDLVSAQSADKLNVPHLQENGIGSYKSYVASHSQRNKAGFITVLPPLHGVQVVEESGKLPYLSVHADADFTWQAVKKFLLDNGIALKKEDPTIGIMVTDWLIDQNKLPKSGLGGLIDGLLSFATDNGERDRYRIRFTRVSNTQTDIVVVYSQAAEKPLYDGFNKKDPSGFSWEITDNKNPELQLEMTRRIALYIAQQLEITHSH